MYSLYMPPPPGVTVVCMLRFNLIIAQAMEIHIEEKDNRYKCGNRNIKYFPTVKGCQHYKKIHL